MAKKTRVTIIMGSSSDAKVMEGAEAVLKRFAVTHETSVISAHRSPQKLEAYLKKAIGSGVEVIIAAAGKAAHLPGVIASKTNLPVIGVPVQTSDLGGLDSLLSIVQMPPGVPVATVAINGAKNAALLAVQILALNDGVLKKKLSDFKQEMSEGGVL